VDEVQRQVALAMDAAMRAALGGGGAAAALRPLPGASFLRSDYIYSSPEMKWVHHLDNRFRLQTLNGLFSACGVAWHGDRGEGTEVSSLFVSVDSSKTNEKSEYFTLLQRKERNTEFTQWHHDFNH
jgi:hypothetical protein